jgi:prepilin signal peptidase PulO-like enzyme (type II secretory pathway)
MLLGGLGINLSPWSICAFPESLLGAILGFGIVYVINFIGRILNYPDSIGMGDAKLLAGLGAIFGYTCVIPILFLAALGCLLIHLIRKPKNGLSSIIAFGPYLCCAGIGFSIYQMMSFRI